ncbi:FISUMP domain-containing protein [Fibrobacter sp. UWR1]|uniref:FISUMP domain-containing protein n=1 Tax=Fibrobacter sp. UWR1 TaxID=2135645 RepID=UPI001F36F1EA|nr:FISUMP domain-containing protein [Fibrobacter sp. UWR1]
MNNFLKVISRVILSSFPRVILSEAKNLGVHSMAAFSHVIPGLTGNLAVLSVATLLLASCSVYDNYDIDLMQDATASIDSSSSSSESVEGTGNSSSSVIPSGSEESSSSKKDTTYVVIVNPSSSSQKVESAGSSAVDNPGSSSSESVEGTGNSSSSVIPSGSEESSSSKKDTTYVVIVNPSSSSQKVESAGSSAVDNPGSSSSKVPEPAEESSSSEAGFPCGDSTMTRGGVEYETVRIGKLCWTAENLRYKDAIPEKNYTCSLDDDPDCATYGLMYNFAGAKEVCPDGWRLPTKTDLDNLHDYLKKATSELAGNWLKSENGWSGEPGNGSNKAKFNGLPAGYCDEDAECEMMGKLGFWWTSEESSIDFRYVLKLSGNSDEWFNNEELDEIYYASVRCVRE